MTTLWAAATSVPRVGAPSVSIAMIRHGRRSVQGREAGVVRLAAVVNTMTEEVESDG